MPKGHVTRKTMEKREAQEYLRQMVIAELGPMTEAQVSNAKGLKYLVVRDKSGKFLRVGEAMARNSEEETIEVWEKDPSIAAFTDLLNRALDLPAKPAEDVNIKAKLLIGWADE